MWLVLAWACSASDRDPAPAEPGAPTAVPDDVDPDDPTLFATGVVATADLSPGHVVVAKDVMLGSVPSFTPDPLPDVGAAIGATVREPILAGEPVRRERLARRDDGTTGYDALVGRGHRAVRLSVPAFATAGLEAGCPVEVLAAADPSQRPRVLGGTHHRVLGIDPAEGDRATVVVDAPVRAGRTGLEADRVTIVALPLSAVVADEENLGPPAFTPPSRPGPMLAVARRTLLPGVMVRSEDLEEVGGAGLEGLRFATVWAQVPTQPIYPGELPHPLRLAAPGRGLCTAIPDGMRAVAVPADGPVSEDWLEEHVRVRIRDNQLDQLYVGAVDPVGNGVVVFTVPDAARALAVAAATLDTRFEVTPTSP